MSRQCKFSREGPGGFMCGNNKGGTGAGGVVQGTPARGCAAAASKPSEAVTQCTTRVVTGKYAIGSIPSA